MGCLMYARMANGEAVGWCLMLTIMVGATTCSCHSNTLTLGLTQHEKMVFVATLRLSMSKLRSLDISLLYYICFGCVNLAVINYLQTGYQLTIVAVAFQCKSVT